jgi:hypothetical protein
MSLIVGRIYVKTTIAGITPSPIIAAKRKRLTIGTGCGNNSKHTIKGIK